MEKIVERFLKYVSFDTQSAEESETFPSTLKQKELGAYLAEELKGVITHRRDGLRLLSAELRRRVSGGSLGCQPAVVQVVIELLGREGLFAFATSAGKAGIIQALELLGGKGGSV